MALESERGPACAHRRAAQEWQAKIRGVFQELVNRGIRAGTLRASAKELGPVLLTGMMREVILLDVEAEHPSTPRERVAEVLSVFIEGAGVK
jgi:hypothetical protein